jgi:glycerol-3-phosphate acyltransferase PlsY
MSLVFPLIAYLLGSIPFGLLLAKLGGYGDIRNIGSGNIGATNVLRTGNKKLAALTLFLDGFKGSVAVFISFGTQNIYIIFGCALFVVLGHMFPVWLKFKGGKGVATALGALLVLFPFLGLSMIAIWLAVFLIFRISSLAALTAFAAAPLLSLFLFGDENLAALSGLLSLMIFWKHRANIQRILKNEEPKSSFGKKA